MTQEALKLALEALEANQPINYCLNNNGERFPMMQEDPFRFERNNKVIATIKEALREHAMREVQRLGQEIEHDYRTRYDRGCYKCGSHYCPADCPEPLHLVPQQPEQEPVAWLDGPHLVVRSDMRDRLNYKGPWVDLGRAIPDKWTPLLYTIPPQRTWVGLTDNEIALINADYPLPQGFAKAIEAKLKQKNGYAEEKN